MILSSQASVNTKSPSTESETIHMPTENDETRPKEKVHTKRLIQETRNGESDRDRCRASSEIPISESTTVKTVKPLRRSSWNTHPSELQSENPLRQYTIGYTNLALSRSITCSASDRSSDHNLDNESMEMLSEFSYVLD
jgi:hypothetical protein